MFQFLHSEKISNISLKQSLCAAWALQAEECRGGVADACFNQVSCDTASMHWYTSYLILKLLFGSYSA
jgi:hypothetical protein